METKVCSICKKEKEVKYFNKDITRKDGFNHYCKECAKLIHKNRKSKTRVWKKRDRKIYYSAWYKLNKESLNLKKRSCRQNPLIRKEANQRNNKLRREKRKNDELFRFSEIIRGSIRQMFKRLGFPKQRKRSEEMLGIKFENYRLYLESKFEHWMTWDNKGFYKPDTFYFGWDIDHIIPLSSAKTMNELIKLLHYTNTQPLCSHINRDIKRDKLNWLLSK